MNRLHALIAILAVAAPAAAQDTEERVRSIHSLEREGKWEELVLEIERFRGNHPQSPRLPGLLSLELRSLQRAGYDSTARAIGILRDLHQNHPEAAETEQSANLIPQWTGWNWTTFPQTVHSGETKPLQIPIGSPTATPWAPQPKPVFEIFKIPAGPRREQLRLEHAGAEPGRLPRSEWQRILAAPLTPDFRVVEWKSFSPGQYLVEERLDAFRKRSTVTVSSFATLLKYAPGRLLVFTCDPISGGARGGIEIEAGGDDFSIRGKTGADGLLLLNCPRPRGVMAWTGDDLQDCRLDDREDDETPNGPKVYITTDRPVYRPGQTVYYKAIHREFSAGMPVLPATRNVRVEIRDSNDRCLQKQDLVWNDLGTVIGSFRIGDEPPLGTYSVRVDIARDNRLFYALDDEAVNWSQSFQVAAYRKPDVSVSLEFPDAGGATASSFRARIRATAFHGGPVADAEVSWSAGPCYARSKPQAPIFEDPLAWFVPKPEQVWHFGNEDEPWDFVVEGRGRTGPDGTLDVVVSTKSHPYQDRWGIRATVRDLTRLESTGSGAIDLLPGALRLTVGARRLFYSAGEEFDGLVRVTTPDGKPAAGRTVELQALIRRKVANDRALEYEYESVYRGTVVSDPSGLAVFKVRSAEAGLLRLKASAKDATGRRTTERMELRIAGDEDDRDETPGVLADRMIYQEGDVARVLIRVPDPGVTAVLTLESGDLHEVRPLRLERTHQIVEFPLRAAHAPNVTVHLAAWKNGEWLGEGTELLVVPANRILNVEVQADRPQYAPRDHATIRIATTLAGRGAASEVELAIVDEAIFALKPESLDDLRTFFIPSQPEAISTWSTWTLNQRWATPTRGGPLTGAVFAMVEEAKADEPQTLNFATADVRRWFPDTLKWIGAVRTDADGRATVDVEMPDSLTNWRIVARAVSGAGAFGQGRSSTLTRKNVIVRLSAPRFYVVGDEGLVSAVVRNNLPQPQEFRVRLSCAGAESEAAPAVTTVDAGGERRVDWKLKIVKPGTITLKAEALGLVESDAMEIEIPVKEHGDERLATAAGVVKGTWRAELTLPEHAPPSSARLDLRINTPGSDAILEALPLLIGYPYGCVEQTMSRFLPAVTAGRAMARLKIPAPALEASLPGLVEQGLQRLYGFQHEDGGWGWWKYDETHPRMTAYVVYGLAAARDAGYPVDAKTLKAGVARLQEMEPTAFGNFALKQAGGEVRGSARVESDEDHAWLVLAGDRESRALLNTKPPEHAWEPEIRRVALVIRALVSVDRNDPRIAPLVEWLLMNRRGGGWVSTLDTACAVTALTDLLQGEAPKRDARARVNGREVRVEEGRAFVDASFLKQGTNLVEIDASTPVFASALLRYFLDEEMPAPVSGALLLSRSFERLVAGGEEPRWEALESGSLVHPGEEIRMTLSIRSQPGAEYVMIEAPIAAGTEARESETGLWGSWYGRQELRDDRVSVAAQHVWAGVSEYHCRLGPTQPGKYHVLPAKAWPMYSPDVRASSGEFILRVADR